jgi:thioester reductase-like protein
MLKKNMPPPQEISLDPNIHFNNPLAKNIDEPKNIFITGATGFVGAYLLEELLINTSAQIFCLTRAADLENAQQRIQENLEINCLWQEKFSSRIIPVIGDLSQPLLGIEEKKFQELSSIIDTIYHNGAQVNAFFPYEKLKASNVSGTHEVIRLASSKFIKPVFYVSTLAVFFSSEFLTQIPVTEDQLPVLSESLKGGYKQSKCVAERLLSTAGARGLPVCIFRTSRIMGDSKNGIISNLKDLLCYMITACIKIKKYPALEQKINFVPVDYISKSIYALSKQLPWGKTFHLLNSHSISWKNLFLLIESLGYPLQPYNYEEWYKELTNSQKSNPKDKPLLSLSFLLRSSTALLSQKPIFSSTQTTKGLESTPVKCPIIDQRLMKNYLEYFIKMNLIKKH